MPVYAFLYVVVSVLFVMVVHHYGEYYRTSVKLAALVCWIISMITAISYYADPHPQGVKDYAEDQDSRF